MKRSERKPSVGETNSSNSDAAGVDTHTPVQPQDLGKASCERPNAKIKRLVSNMSNATGESFQSSFQGSVDAEKTRRVSRMLEQCEAVGWPFRKKLILANLNLSFVDIPIEGICSEKIGPFLYKLSLRGNSIFVVPHSLVTRLMGLKTLDLSNCGLEELPDVWDLPSLKKLCLGRNKLTTFPSDVSESREIVLYDVLPSSLILVSYPCFANLGPISRQSHAGKFGYVRKWLNRVKTAK